VPDRRRSGAPGEGAPPPGPTGTPDSGARPLLVAYGNRLRGDDGIGWHVAEAVRTAAPPGSVRIITVHQLAPEIAEAVAAAPAVVFVDAACNAAPGAVAVTAVHPEPRPAAGLTQHQYGPGELLRLGSLVFGHRPPAAWLVTIGAADFDGGEHLSPPVAAALPRAAASALHLLDLAPAAAPTLP
jgi:hydrogenase maturation protease